MIRVLINGAYGRMGQETQKAVSGDSKLQLVAALGHSDNLVQAIADSQAQVVIDFTTPAAVFANATTIIEMGAHPVIGTTGLQPDQIKELTRRCDEKKLGGIVAPNFAIGAILMMKFASLASQYFPDAEIIEFHHPGKLDAPSGTAIKTAEMIASHRKQEPAKLQQREVLQHPRGAVCQGVSIHSVRLPGLIAHQQVIFGGLGETLTIRHDSLHRESFMPGVLLACKKVLELDKLVYGLEHIL